VTAQVRHSIAAEEAKFIINRQVLVMSRANPGVSSAFLFLVNKDFHTALCLATHGKNVQ